MLEGDFRGWFKKLAHVTLTLSLVSIPLHPFRKNIRLYFSLLFPFYLLAPLAVLYTLTYRIPVKFGALAVVLETDFSEAKEFAETFGLRLALLLSLFLLTYALLLKSVPLSPTITVTLSTT